MNRISVCVLVIVCTLLMCDAMPKLPSKKIQLSNDNLVYVKVIPRRIAV